MVKPVVANSLRELTGKEIWFRSSRCDVNSGIIKGVKGEAHAQVIITHTDDHRDIGSITHVHANDIYLDKLDLLGANYERWQARISALCSQMPDAESIVKFCYMHNVGLCGDQTDWDARSAVRRQAKKLFGIEIDPDTAHMEEALGRELGEA